MLVKGVTYPDVIIFRTCDKIPSIWTEAYAPDVQVPRLLGPLID